MNSSKPVLNGSHTCPYHNTASLVFYVMWYVLDHVLLLSISIFQNPRFLGYFLGKSDLIFQLNVVNPVFGLHEDVSSL